MVATRPFGVEHNMDMAVESYVGEIRRRGLAFITDQTSQGGAMTELSWEENLPDTAENTYESLMQKHKLAEAIAWKAVLREAESMPSETEKLDVSNGGMLIKKRFNMIIDMVHDQVRELVSETDFTFLEAMDEKELIANLEAAWADKDISAVIYYISAYSLYINMKKTVLGTKPTEPPK